MLDSMAGAFLFLDKEDSRIEIVPMEEYNASELSEVGITEKTLYHLIGKVCRSPMCESVFTHMVKEAGLADRFLIDSAATSTEEIGNPVHWGTVNKLKEVGIPLVPTGQSRSKQQIMINLTIS